MEQASGEEWARKLFKATLDNVKKERERQGLSAQKLSELCADLGYPIARSVISKMGGKSRASISLPELLALAAALEVPPIALLYSPLDSGEVIERLPGEQTTVFEALREFTGEAPRLSDGYSEGERVTWRNSHQTAYLLAMLRHLHEAEREALAALEAVKVYQLDPARRGIVESNREFADDQVRKAVVYRRILGRHSTAVTPIPEPLRGLYEEIEEREGDDLERAHASIEERVRKATE